MIKILKLFSFLSVIYISYAYATDFTRKDADLYKQIFALQQQGKWTQADTLIKKIDNKIILGHVYYQRYMHPTAYRSSYKELHLWMKQYADHPNATKIYKLAQKRRPSSGWKPLPKPIRPTVPSDLKRTYEADDIMHYKIYTNTVYPSAQKSLLNTIKNSVRRGRVTIAYNYLNENRKKLSKKAHAEALGIITQGYYKYHKTSRVFEIAEEAYKMHPETSYYASWWAGLEAYRQQQYTNAVTYFMRSAKGAEPSKNGFYTGAYYWAGKSALKTGKKFQAKGYFQQATEVELPYRTTFYSLLSQQILNGRPIFDFTTSGTSKQNEDTLLRVKSIARAYALSMSGAYTRAEMEVRQVQRYIKKSYQIPLLQFSYTMNLPHMQKHISGILSMDQRNLFTGYAYPNIPYTGINSQKTNPSFVLAFMRQESNFKTFAISSVGARGLMQVMPATARYIDKSAKLGIFSNGYTKHLMIKPEISITLGESYLLYLLNMYKNNLILTVAAYNAGPGNIQKWRKDTHYNNDPLLLIESIPSGETRHFIESVLSNYWIYRLKNNLPTPTLTDIANGQWSNYMKNTDMQAEINRLQKIHPSPNAAKKPLIKVIR